MTGKNFWGASVVEKNYLFENFIRGEANQIAYAASLEVAQRSKSVVIRYCCMVLVDWVKHT